MTDVTRDLPEDAADELSDALHGAKVDLQRAAGVVEEECGTDHGWYTVLMDLSEDAEVMESALDYE